MHNIKIAFLQIVILVLGSTTLTLSQNMIDRSKLYSDYALSKNRREYINDLNKKITTIFGKELNSASESEWRSLFREAGLIFYRNDDIYRAVQKSVFYSLSASIKFNRSLVETILILYPNDFQEFVGRIQHTTSDPTLYAYAVHYKLRQNDSLNVRENISAELKKRFPDWEKFSQLKFLNYYLLNSEIQTPNLKRLFTHTFMKGKTIIYSLQRKNRLFPGLTIIKKPDGTFVKGKNDSIFHIKQLAVSVSGLPGYLSQGNTPQGIFSIVGFYVSPTPSIGPTANVITRIPFEVSTDLFYHGLVKNKKWELENYKSLLPKSWKDYLPIFESFYAGKTGRRKIVMHGSVDDLTFYKDEPYYPLTPSKGCLTAKEIWSEETGRNVESDQTKLMNAFFSTGNLKGFLVVVDIDNKESDVTIDEILHLLKK